MTKTKKTGINIRLDAFIEIDKTNFAKQRDAYAMMATVQETGKLPTNFWDLAVIIGAPTCKPGSADVPEPVVTGDQDKTDPANWPLTTDALPEGATVLESITAFDGSIFQTIRTVDGTETFRRISDEQDRAETGRGIDQTEGNQPSGKKK